VKSASVVRAHICFSAASSASSAAVTDHFLRFLDVGLVLLTAWIWIPLLFVVVAAQWAFEGRPVFFRQVRVGQGGRKFLIYKIRTTPRYFRGSPADWPTEVFPPRTLLGRLLRRCDLDELPQLWNVLRGEMSLVGPRPETGYHSAIFLRTMPRYGERMAVRPGLTGLAQVRGWRGDTSVHERLAADIEYIARRGAATYARILTATAWIEFRNAAGFRR
jgi:lipopolysaccharide/colanic/teichoic acid biosynthesis glycosyltransferase